MQILCNVRFCLKIVIFQVLFCFFLLRRSDSFYKNLCLKFNQYVYDVQIQNRLCKKYLLLVFTNAYFARNRNVRGESRKVDKMCMYFHFLYPFYHTNSARGHTTHRQVFVFNFILLLLYCKYKPTLLDKFRL